MLRLISGAFLTRCAFCAFLALVSLNAEAEDETLRYRVEIDAPSELRAAVISGLDLMRWQAYSDMTVELLDRLMLEAREQAREIAATEGYFSPQIETRLERESNPAVVRLIINAGVPVRIEHTELRLEGPILTRPDEYELRLEPARRGWSLPDGRVFRQQDWDSAKQNAVRTIAARDYAAARIASSRADIDPDLLQARLELSIDSGPPFRFGAIQVSGGERYGSELVRNLSDLQLGEPYSVQRLNQIQRRIASAGYFASVQARIETDPARADAAPVVISVIEAPSRRLEAGLGYSTDTLFRVQTKYSNANFRNAAVQLQSELKLESRQQSASLNFNLPPRAGGIIDAFGGNIEHTEIAGLSTRGGVAYARRRNLDERDGWGYELSFHSVKQTAVGLLSEGQSAAAPAAAEIETDNAYASYAEYERTWRRVDDLLAPSSGHVVSARAGIGIPRLSSRGFGRVILKSAWYRPVGRNGNLQLRAEAGAVLARARSDIPADLLFRTGGDNSVRGYGFESLGLRRGDVTVGGRYYALGSAEYIHWLDANYGVAAFIDAGNAGESFQGLDPAIGYGFGGRLRTPIGPFRVDLAYGKRTGALRLHLSMGVNF